MLNGEEEELAHLACVPWLVGVEENDEIEFATFFDDGSNVWVGDVEVLGVGVELDFFDAEFGNAIEFVEGCLLVCRMYGDDRVEVVRRCCDGSDYGIVLLAGLFGLSLTGYDDESAFGYSGSGVQCAESISADGLGWCKTVGFPKAEVCVGIDDGAFVLLRGLRVRLKSGAQKGCSCGAKMFPVHPLDSSVGDWAQTLMLAVAGLERGH